VVYHANGIMPNPKHNKPLLFGVWFINLSINITQCEVDALGRTRFVLVQGAPPFTPTTQFKELHILPRVAPCSKLTQNSCETMFLMNMFKMKDVATIDATSQIYKLHGFVPNLCEICYFMGSYRLHINVMHYLNMEVVCMTFVCKQHK
jgi:hypothetical protein